MAFVPVYILILGITIVIDYTAAIYLERVIGPRRTAIMVVSIVATCIVLFIFKYFDFFTGSFVGLAGVLGWNLTNPSLNIILPIGLSFHTFQSLSYVVEVYRGHQRAERDFTNYATYVMFFPQLVAGPIERPQNLLGQFREYHAFEYPRIVSGLKRMAWGFFKKLVIADRLALYVNDVYAYPTSHNGLQLTIATIFFAYQIYCDFSGYSDIAIGSARVLGFKLMENFDRPYSSLSVAEFWRRWHISLSTWFRDYVYFPLGGSRVDPLRRARNILITFGISGLWHGANWTYLLWGLLNGTYLIIGWITEPLTSTVFRFLRLRESHALRRAIMLASTFVLTCGAWVLFRANSVSDAWHIYTHWTRGWSWHEIATEHFSLKHLVLAIAAVLALEIIQYVNHRVALDWKVSQMPTLIRWPAYVSFVFLVLLLGVFRSNQFIYFQF
jgi:alginate O-acetyltransferase complex protein AlgI